MLQLLFHDLLDVAKIFRLKVLEVHVRNPTSEKFLILIKPYFTAFDQ
ncbi:hypothetical protein A33I_00800 [Alkalihalophilus marmarensis DSM 21297]|uniref:Uncharacterized protein n=1 Tax=Alkalihalophilus marmarensis DSM 21297 TaxID=1188261 RepID=U6SLY6_9BACI|nr:hypothetical protein A33I_00800 [Alkalihalophilus marmarensis DSM 21297]